ncbi:F-box/LRR-repeat protein 25-like protein [Tanacetum coccineum]
MKRQVINRISSLPDCLLVDIISHLDSTEESIRTGTLSKRWQDLWLQLPNLIFNYKDCDEDRIFEFYSSVENILIRYGLSKLNKFQLHAWFKDQGDVKSCIRYAIDPNCYFHNLDVLCWKNLRSLSIAFGIFDEDLFQNILSGTPVLETLALESCCGFELIDITNESVKNFVGILLLNMSSVVQAELDYCTTNNFYHMEMHEHHRMSLELLKGLILSLTHIKELKVGQFCLKDYNGREMWPVVEATIVIVPPLYKPQIGRPPKKRKKSHDEIANESCSLGNLSRKGKSVSLADGSNIEWLKVKSFKSFRKPGF